MTAAPNYPFPSLRLTPPAGSAPCIFFGCSGSSSLHVDIFSCNEWAILLRCCVDFSLPWILWLWAPALAPGLSGLWALESSLSGCGDQVQLPSSIRNLHIPGIKNVSPALTLLNHLLSHQGSPRCLVFNPRRKSSIPISVFTSPLFRILKLVCSQKSAP